MAEDLFDCDELLIGKTYGWYNIKNQRFCGKFRGVKETPTGSYLMMEYKSRNFPEEILHIKEVPGRFPKALKDLVIFKTEKALADYLRHVGG